MHGKLILEAGIALEFSKHTCIDKYHKARHRVSEWADSYDKQHKSYVELCSNNIMCLAESRHKHNCPMTSNYSCTCYKCTGERSYIEGVM